MTAAPDVEALVERARAGDARSVARLISLVEDAHPAVREVMAALSAYAGKATVIGLTGPPGVGKSTTTDALVTAFRTQRKRVGVLAVDPTSPFSGGALLGDRVRMQAHALDREVYIRSMATRGHLGGLSFAAPQAVRVLDAAGCDVVLVETVGVGQSEVEVAGTADTTVVLLAPGSGDAVQAAKAGILEIGDVYVVNKADRDGAASTVRELQHMLSLADRAEPDAWTPPVLTTIASRGVGVGELLDALSAHRSHQQRTGGLQVRRLSRAAGEVEAIALTSVRARVSASSGDGSALLNRLAGDVVEGRLDPYAAADVLLAALAT